MFGQTIRRTPLLRQSWLTALAFLALCSATHAAVYVNEFMAVNGRFLLDDTGRYSDWVELFNLSTTATSIGGWYMSDDPLNRRKWRIPAGTRIAPGAHLLIWCDDTSPPNPLLPLHAPFKLSGDDGEWIALYNDDGTTVNAKQFGVQASNISYGRRGDSDPVWWPFHRPTPGGQNIVGGYTPPPSRLAGKLFINEWLTSNTRGIRDNVGKREDWFELYNATNIPIDLGGYYVTDNLTRLTKWQIPAGNVIGPRGFAVFYADNDPEEGLNHANFGLSDRLGSLRISEATDWVLIDQISYGRQTADVSQGRVTDGGAPPFVFFAIPTPRQSNVPKTRAQSWQLYR